MSKPTGQLSLRWYALTAIALSVTEYFILVFVEDGFWVQGATFQAWTYTGINCLFLGLVLLVATLFFIVDKEVTIRKLLKSLLLIGFVVATIIVFQVVNQPKRPFIDM